MQVSKLLLLSSLIFNREETKRCLERVFEKPVVVIRSGPKKYQNFDNQKPDTYLISLENENLEEILEEWSSVESFNPQAKFWFIFETKFPAKIFKIVSKFFLQNVRLVTPTGQVYTYSPYKHENVANPDTTPIFLGNCQNLGQFSVNLPKFWRNTTVRVLTKCLLPYVDCSDLKAGLESQILDLIQAFVKFKIRQIFDKSFKFGLAKINGSYSASFRFLQERQVDMTVGSFRSIGSTQFRDFDFSVNHMEDKLVWVVPKALPMLHWIRIIKIFEAKFWLILVILTLAMAKIFEKIAKFSQEPTNFYRKFGFRVAAVILVGSYLKKTPQRFELRLVFIFWIYFCMILNIIFNSNLTNVFFGTFHTFQVNSFDDIIQSNLEIGLTDDVMHILSQDSNWATLTSHKPISSCAFGAACLNRTISQRNLVCCWGERSIKFRMAKFYTTQVHYIDDHLLFFYLLFYFIKGYPIVPQISRIILQLKSAGLIQFIKAKVDKIEAKQGNEIVSKILTFKRLEGPFYLLVVGWVSGILVFGYEIIKEKKERIVEVVKTEILRLGRSIRKRRRKS